MNEPDFNDHIDLDIRGFHNDRFVIGLQIRPYHLNRYGIVHGGVLFSILDTAMSRAFFDMLAPEENTGVTLEMKINYLKAVKSGTLTAFGVLTKRTRRTAFVEGHIENEDGELVAKAAATMLLTDS